MAEQDDATRVWELIDKIGFCMLTSRSGDDLRARPMSAYSAQLENAVYFLTDVASHKDDEIARSPKVCLAFADTKGQKYVSVSGVAEVQNDREKIKELWATPAKACWDNADDPSIRILKDRLRPNTGTARARSSAISKWRPQRFRSKPDMGDNAEVKL